MHNGNEAQRRIADLERELADLRRAQAGSRSGDLKNGFSVAGPQPVELQPFALRQGDDGFLRLHAEIIQSMSEGVSVADENGFILYTNPAEDRMFGYEAGELIGQHVTVQNAYGKEENERKVAEVIAVLRAGQTWAGEWLNRKKNGESFYTYARISPLTSNGKSYWVCVQEDITERKGSEALLRASAERLRLTLRASRMGDWSWDAATDVVTLSERAAALFATPPGGQMTWTELQTLIHPQDRERARLEVERVIAEHSDYELEYRLVGEGREGRWVLATGQAIYDSDDRVTGMLGVITDVTERKELLRSEQEARATAELLNSVGPILAGELILEKLVQSVTDLATALVGAQFGAFFHKVTDEGGEAYMLYTLSGVAREAFSKFPMPRNTEIFSPTFRGEGVLRSDDITKDPRYGRNTPYRGMPEGHLPVRSYLAVPVISRSSEVMGGLFFGHADAAVFSKAHEQLVTGIAAQAAIAIDNARLFEQLRRERARVEETNLALRRANADLEQFAYSASHDLQEPLRMVSIYSQLLRKRFGSQLGDKGDEYIHYTIEGATRMENLVRDLLAYTSASSATNTPTEAVESGTVLQSAIANLRVAIQQTGAMIQSGPLPQVRMHQVHLEQLFQNLLGNAIKYRSAEPLRIAVTAELRDREWLFAVKDNGIGIDPQYKEHIFGIFKRLHTPAEYSGTGIGLAICQRIVERAGGRIWVDSELGRGATFFFTIPAGDATGTGGGIVQGSIHPAG